MGHETKMTIIILAILAVVAVCVGVFLLFVSAKTTTNERLLVELLVQYTASIGLILVGIFIILLALLFKSNPFW